LNGRNFSSVFFVTSSALLFEIYLTSQFVISFDHHFASIVVSTAMLGIGASGVVIRVFPNFSQRFSLKTTAFLLSVSYPLSLMTIRWVEFDPVQLDWDLWQILKLSTYYPILAIPFLLSSFFVVKTMKENFSESGNIYFTDMAGAGFGSILFLALSRHIGFPPMTSTALALFGANLVGKRDELFRNIAISIMVLTFSAMKIDTLELPISNYKDISHFQKYPNTEILASFRGPEGRVDIVRSPYLRHAPGLNPSFSKPVPPMRGVFFNGSLYAPLYENSKGSDLPLPLLLPYLYRKPNSVLIVGASGTTEYDISRDIGCEVIHMLEENRLIANSMLFSREFVYKIEISGLRKYLSEAIHYDLISFSRPFTGAGTGTGTLSEDYLSTKEVVRSSIDHLTADGILTVAVPLLPPPRVENTLVQLFVSASSDGWNKVVAFRSWGTFTLIYQNSTFTKEQISRLREIADGLFLDPVYFPGISENDTNRNVEFREPIYFMAIQDLKNGKETLFNTDPPTDDAPFFENFLKFSRIPETVKAFDGRWLPILTGGGMDILIIAQTGLFSLFLLLLPLIRKTAEPLPKNWITYFFSLGAGYMLVEMVFIQKGVLFLGGPVKSFAFVVPVMLFSSAIGGYFSKKVQFHQKITVSIAIILIIDCFLFKSVFANMQNMNFTLMNLLFILMVAVTGFILGFPYPLGLRVAGSISDYIIPWGMAANGFASVLGASSAPLLAYLVGFSNVLLIGALIYLIASFVAFQPHRGK